MDIGKEYYITIGILALSLSYVMFTGQQYFSALAMAGLFVLALLAVISFLLPHLYKEYVKRPELFALTLGVVLVCAIAEYAYIGVNPTALLSIGSELVVLLVSAPVSVAGIHYLGKALRKTQGLRCVLYAVASIATLTLLAYSIMYIATGIQWHGIDEVAFNYYAAYLLVHGQNPYTVSMQPILAAYNVQPTILLNGGYEYAYDYPALSFISFVFLPLLGIKNMLSFAYLTIFITLAASFLVYRRSGHDRRVLIPLAGWILATYALVGVASQYLAVPGFLLLAYLFRHRPLLSGLFLGLGASTIQLTWFALPFFYILMFKEAGGGHAAKVILATVAVFFLINGYFIVTNPSSVSDIFSLFGLTKLSFFGTNIMQTISFYPLPYWYSAFISVLTYVVMLALFFLYTKTLKPLLALVPMTIFFLSWRNITIYGLPFVGLLLAIYLWKDESRYKDMIRSKLPAVAAVMMLAVVGCAVAVAAHESYSSKQLLRIGHILPVISVANGYYSQQFGLLGVKLTVNNTLNRSGNVSFYVVSRNPNNEEYLLAGSFGPASANSEMNYSLNYQLPLVVPSTQLIIFAFDQDYITSVKINFTNIGAGYQ